MAVFVSERVDHSLAPCGLVSGPPLLRVVLIHALCPRAAEFGKDCARIIHGFPGGFAATERLEQPGKGVGGKWRNVRKRWFLRHGLVHPANGELMVVTPAMPSKRGRANEQ